ncbi:ABC transporter permease [Aliirhizobium cellulosilyticum]|uniref:Peptide/nickel transport system permease protein n=1 Tax=Aliirhizobium cellulosilyticum TaxID=393664 RepID=A0A7W6S8U1_9HYPH|nr:ABC transporter permease [Rhizobium cellulosilyticum]MBB4349313.1 peptide/nickel transport system permease protein [Rhizobium cellulosilyticum]MBB4412465.1 peptide/nickel transport system permease protein [Rhizobium cellulosilyticum]MBB4447097.1 peptide/nickel transport system permease protein [Rhizobium cellulosilyticum]
MSDTITGLDVARQRGASRRDTTLVHYTVVRLLLAVLTVWLVASLVFVCLTATGDPVSLMLDPDTSVDERARVAAVLGYDKSLGEQYVGFLWAAASGDFPVSLRYQENALFVALDRLPASLLLGSLGLLVGATVGIVLGAISVVSKNALIANVPIVFAAMVDAVPTFFLGVLLILLFGIFLRLVPISGSGSLTHLLLPVGLLATTVAAPIARVFRAALLEARTADHIVAAQARGLSASAVFFRHIFMNSLIPVANVGGVQAGMVFGGAVIVETLFRWPGIGQLIIGAIQNRDFPLITACVLILSVGFALVTFIVDVIAVKLDPRTRQ